MSHETSDWKVSSPSKCSTLASRAHFGCSSSTVFTVLSPTLTNFSLSPAALPKNLLRPCAARFSLLAPHLFPLIASPWVSLEWDEYKVSSTLSYQTLPGEGSAVSVFVIILVEFDKYHYRNDMVRRAHCQARGSKFQAFKMYSLQQSSISRLTLLCKKNCFISKVLSLCASPSDWLVGQSASDMDNFCIRGSSKFLPKKGSYLNLRSFPSAAPPLTDW